MSKKRLLLLGVALFAVFVYFSFLVHRGHFNKIDFDLTVKFQDHIPRKFDLPFSVLTLLGSAEVTGVIWLGFVLYSLFKKYWLTAISLSLFLSSALFELYGKAFVYHPAPPFMFYRGALGFVFPSSFVQTNYSYPSGHATRTTFLAIFLILFLASKRITAHKLLIQASLVVFIAAIYISRIYLGEHWASDVVGGALLGASLGIFSGLTIPTEKRVNS